jgi:hypothetical protein
MGLMIPLIAALTPDDYEVALCDERLEGINWDGGWNLVGMTTTIGEFLPPTTLAIKTTSPGTGNHPCFSFNRAADNSSLGFIEPN